MASLKQLIQAGFTTRQGKALRDMVVPTGLDDMACAAITYYGTMSGETVSRLKDPVQSVANGPALPLNTTNPFHFQQYDQLDGGNAYRYGDGHFMLYVSKLADANGIPLSSLSPDVVWEADRVGGVITLPTAGAGWSMAKDTDASGDYGIKLFTTTPGWYSAGMMFTRA